MAEDLAAVDAYAVRAVRQAFPVTRGWSDHAYTATETPAHVLRQAASELETEPKLSRKQRRREREKHEAFHSE